MKAINKEDIRKLNEVKSKYFISIYIPTNRAGEAVTNGKDIILFKNQVQVAKNELVKKGMTESESKEILQPAYKLIDDTGFWRHQTDGLAVFLADDFFAYYHVPYPLEESTTVANSFILKELMPLFQGDGLYYVLTLSLNHINFFEASRNSIRKIDLPEDMPKNFEEATTELEVEKSLQFRSKHTTAGEGTMYHGQGGGKDDIEEFVLEDYLRSVAKGIYAIVKDEKAPMILYGTEKIKSLYHQVNLYKHLMDDSLEGNPDEVKIGDIQKKSWDALRDTFRKNRESHIQKYSELAGTGKTSYNIAEIVPAASNGRVEALFVANGIQKWGTFDEEKQSVEIKKERDSDDLCLLNKAAIDTFLNNGDVYILDKEHLPEYSVDTPMVAVMRF